MLCCMKSHHLGDIPSLASRSFPASWGTKCSHAQPNKRVYTLIYVNQERVPFPGVRPVVLRSCCGGPEMKVLRFAFAKPAAILAVVFLCSTIPALAQHGGGGGSHGGGGGGFSS